MRTFGEGAPLLMLAGAGGRGAGFMPLARRWRAQYRAYMPDPCAPFAPEEAARGLLARMREAGVERFDVLGASLGGCTALAMAALAPERVRSLTLCAAFARLDEETAGRLAALRGRRLALPDDAFDAEWMDLLYGDMPRPAGSGGMPADALAAQLEAALAFDGRPLLPRIRCPVCVTFGREDRLIPPRLSRELARGVAGAALEAYPGGHMHFLALQAPAFMGF